MAGTLQTFIQTMLYDIVKRYSCVLYCITYFENRAETAPKKSVINRKLAHIKYEFTIQNMTQNLGIYSKFEIRAVRDDRLPLDLTHTQRREFCSRTRVFLCVR